VLTKTRSFQILFNENIFGSLVCKILLNPTANLYEYLSFTDLKIRLYSCSLLKHILNFVRSNRVTCNQKLWCVFVLNYFFTWLIFFTWHENDNACIRFTYPRLRNVKMTPFSAVSVSAQRYRDVYWAIKGGIALSCYISAITFDVFPVGYTQLLSCCVFLWWLIKSFLLDKFPQFRFRSRRLDDFFACPFLCLCCSDFRL
jgi:hypothetical protein